MRKTKIIIFILFMSIYAIGVFAGALREIKAPKQSEMYEYLEQSVSQYETGIKGGIKTVAKDNITNLALMIAGGLFKPLFWMMGVGISVKGYFTGFSVMAVLRLYGIKGLILCGGNMISSAVTVPAAAYFCSNSFYEMFINKAEMREYYRRFAVISIFLTAVFCADCFVKGFLTSIFMKWGSKLI